MNQNMQQHLTVQLKALLDVAIKFVRLALRGRGDMWRNKIRIRENQ